MTKTFFRCLTIAPEVILTAGARHRTLYGLGWNIVNNNVDYRERIRR
jgi:hypothetical protein